MVLRLFYRPLALRYAHGIAVPAVHCRVTRLCSQLRAVVDKLAGAAGVASIELQVNQCLSKRSAAGVCAVQASSVTHQVHDGLNLFRLSVQVAG
jgi:hypothetical protein